MTFPNTKEIGFHNSKINGFSITFPLQFVIKEKVSLYSQFGIGKINPSFSILNNFYKIRGKEDLFLVGGAKISLIEAKEFLVGVDGKYYYFKSDVISVSQNMQNIASDNMYQKYYGYQIGVSIAKKINIAKLIK